VLLAVVLIALGETAGAVMPLLRPELARYARARVAANPQAHGLAGSAEYDGEVTARAVFAAEAGLSFFHTHAQGLGPVVLFASTVAATVVHWWPARAALYALFTVGGLFPVGYLAYSVATLELGRESGVELAERYILTLLAVVVLILVGRRPRTQP
jgi:hypothetical protein